MPKRIMEEKSDFMIWFDRYYESVFSYVSRKISSNDDVEDIVQEIFFHLWKFRKSLFTSESPESIVIKTTHQKIADFYRKNKHIHTALNEQEDLIHDDETVGNDTEKEMKKIKELLKAIPFRRQKIFIMNKLENKTQREIAKEFKMSVSAVENQIRKTMIYLKANINLLCIIHVFVLS